MKYTKERLSCKRKKIDQNYPAQGAITYEWYISRIKCWVQTLVWLVNESFAVWRWIFSSFTVGVWQFECVSVSACMNSQSVNECRPWQRRTDEMIHKQGIVLPLVTSVGSPEQIILVEVDDGAKLPSEGFCFQLPNNHCWKSRKDLRRLNVLLNEIKCLFKKRVITSDSVYFFLLTNICLWITFPVLCTSGISLIFSQHFPLLSYLSFFSGLARRLMDISGSPVMGSV